ncbi:MAG: PQQ-dependent sugar dehydrogenase, partial [Planctomycetota bacterium]
EDSKNVPLAILANDFLIGNPGFELVGLPSQGSAKIVDGELRYTPDENFVGTDRLSYRLLGGSEATVEVVIEVNESFQQPQSLIDPRIPDEISPSGKTLQVSKLVQLPFDDNGRPPRVNMMTTLGQRTFVVTDGAFGGNARIFELVSDSVGSVQAILFFDVGQAIATYGNGTSIDGGSPLNGLRSAAFHPNFGDNGKFYVTFVGTRPEQDNGTIYLSNPENPVAVESVLAEFTFDFESNSVDPESYREVFRVGMPVNDHPIRQAVFNPYAVEGDRDFGLLYIGHGDGSEQSAVAGDGQNQDALGKIIRIDPLATETASFTIPEFNPFSESGDYPTYVYAVGFRNPHNLSFAIGENDETQLIVTDIGRDNIEEINIVIAGGNYGWADREGTFVHLNGPGQTNGVNSNIAALPENDAENDFIYPVSQLGHDGEIGDPFVGQAIAGGHVIQNGSSELADQFIFLEFATDGRAFHFDFTDAQNQTTSLDIADVDRDSPDELTWLTPSELTILFDHDDDPLTTPLVRNSLKDVLDDEPDFQTVLTSGKVRADLRLGRGPDGELYVLNKRNGWIYLATNTVAPTPDESA